MKHVTLNDDLIGNLNGWNPDGAVTSFSITDGTVSTDSLIVVSIQKSGVPFPLMAPNGLNCSNLFPDNGFFFLSSCSISVNDGSTLRYSVINPYP